MEENTQQTETPQPQANSSADETNVETPTTNNSAVELEAYKQVNAQLTLTVEKLQKELHDVKVANATLALTQPIGKQQTAEEVLNDMF